MPHVLKNKDLEIHIDLPEENYNFSRFDWTGKISKVVFKDIPVSTIERTDNVDEHLFGKAFYNEFGIDSALGFEDVEVGEWFHKIGVGLLKKHSETYSFFEKHDIQPAEFKINADSEHLVITCKSNDVAGYSYVLKKTITINEGGFKIDYTLQNNGKKDIITDEYVHNFTAINNELMGTDYILKFPFQLKPRSFNDYVDPEQKIEIKKDSIKFNGSPREQFFFSNLSGNKNVSALWELVNLKNKIGIRETGSFKTDKINLWGWEHVISPELFIKIHVRPGESAEWSRMYTFFEIS